MKALLLLPLAAATALATGDFYEESIPTLPTFLGYDRLPKKTLEDIADEISPAPEGAEPDYGKEIRAIADGIKAGKAPHDFVAKVDALLTAERLNREGNGVNALLHDLRDLCSGPASAADAAGYLQWRLAHGYALGYNVTDAQEVDRNEFGGGELDDKAKQELAEIDKLTAAAPPAVQPHYLYAHGAYLFRLGHDDESEELFQKVVDQFPTSPRAEAAAYMVTRCLMRESRTADNDGYKNDPAKAGEARKAMQAFLEKYPQSPYAGDVQGWLGGLEMFAGHYAEALPCFIRQLDIPGHPEFAESAGKEIEICFRALHDNPQALADALTDPRVAQAAVYFAGNEIEPVDGNGEFESGDFVAAWRKSLCVALAKALAGKPELFKAPGWEPRYRSMLALAASGAGDQKSALAFFDGIDAAATDDLALAHAVVLQRAKRLHEAADAYALLARKYPDSVLTPAARVREALVLMDDHRAGEAALLLMALAEPKAPKPAAAPDQPKEDVSDTPDEEADRDDYGLQRDLPGVEPDARGQIRQLLDTVYNFAPLPELATAAQGQAGPEEFRVRLRAIIAVRHLARERFAEARPFMTPAQWDLLAGPLADLTAAAQAAKTPAEKAATAMKLADAWAAARGRLLTAPLDAEEWRKAVFKDDHPAANFHRLENGPALGFPTSPIDLENRDELRHAFNWWLTASDAQPRTPQAATATWRALRAMPDIATVSPFTLDRAKAKKWDEVSRKLHDRLQKENPASPEAKRLAVWWTFPPGKNDDGTPVMREDPSSWKESPELGDDQASEDEIKARVGKVLPAASASLEALRKEVAAGHQWAKQKLQSLPAQCVVNFYEDLDQFLATPGLTAEVAKEYTELRYDTLLSGAIGFDLFEARPDAKAKDAPGTVRADDALLADIRAAMADPKFAKVQDFLGFLEIAVTANHWVAIPMNHTSERIQDKDGNEPTYWGRDYVALEKLCAAWLAKYPKSPKRPAAMLLHARALRHAMEPYVFYKQASWPVARRWEGVSLPVEVPRLKLDAKAWKGALDQYNKEFPKGEYADDILSLRADLAVDLKDWKRAVQITLDELNGREHLQPSAHDRLALIFSHLANDDDRADLLAAIRATGGARGALVEYLKSIEGVSEHPLALLRDWLTEEAQQ